MTSSFDIQCGNNYIMKKTQTFSCNILFILFMEDGGWVISADASVRKYLIVNSPGEKKVWQDAKKKKTLNIIFTHPCLV